MQKNFNEHIISTDTIARQALQKLDSLPDNESRTLFVVNENNHLVGTLTDGDIRRGLLIDREITDSITLYMNRSFKYIPDGKNIMDAIEDFKKLGIILVPFLNEEKEMTKIIDLRNIQTILPICALIMAGGRGERLKPLTDAVPKPMLKVGSKPIIEHNIDRLIKYGITEFYISVRYLSEQIIDYFGDGSSRNISITYLHEDEPLGTIGALGRIPQLNHEHVLVMNSDILTNLDFEDFFKHFLSSKAKMCLASVPYSVKIPYGVLDVGDDCKVASLKEKPTYTYYSNAGIYFLESSIREYIPTNSHFNATDLMDKLIELGQNVIHYPLLNYWLDIGKYDDYVKAQQDIKHINL